MPGKKSAAGSPLRILLCGALGRMGRRVALLAQEDPRFRVIAGVEHSSRASSPQPFPLIPAQGMPAHLGKADVLIDFSSPEASVRFAEAAASARKPLVIGTTGFTPSHKKSLDACAKKIPIFLCPNFSPGMNLLFHLARVASSTLPHYDITILETHHTQKKDAPSGTALRLAQAARHPRRKDIPIVSQRLGTVVGEHTLSLAGPHERIELTHRAESRDVFARGALEAALWVRRKRPGLYDMMAMLHLS